MSPFLCKLIYDATTATTAVSVAVVGVVRWPNAMESPSADLAKVNLRMPCSWSLNIAVGEARL